MFNDLKLDINLANYSFKTTNRVDQIIKESGICEYINEIKDYDKEGKNGLITYIKIKYLQEVKNEFGRICLANINNYDGNYLLHKLMQLSKYTSNREKYNFIVEGIIYNIYIDHYKPEEFYQYLLKIFGEYCIHYDIFDTVLLVYPDPYIFVEDFTEIFKVYFDYVTNQIEKNTLKQSNVSALIYAYMCADEYFPILQKEVEERVKDIEIPKEMQKELNIVKLIPLQ